MAGGDEWKIQARALTARAKRAAAELARDVDERTGLVQREMNRILSAGLTGAASPAGGR